MEALLLYAEVKARETEGKLEGFKMATKLMEENNVHTYKEALKTPKIRKKPVARDSEKVMLIYPTNETKKDSEETKKELKKTLVLKAEGLQIRAVRKMQRGGVVVEIGTKSGAQKLKEITAKVTTLKTAVLKKINLSIIIYDADRELAEEEIKECTWK